MRRSERRNNLQICPRRDSNTGGSDLWSSTLPLDHGGALCVSLSVCVPVVVPNVRVCVCGLCARRLINLYLIIDVSTMPICSVNMNIHKSVPACKGFCHVFTTIHVFININVRWLTYTGGRHLYMLIGDNTILFVIDVVYNRMSKSYS